jgi:hypothetical protein
VDWCRDPSPSIVVVALTMVVELQEQLHARERELDSREGALLEQEDGMLAFECALGRVRMEYNVECN